MRKEQHVLYIIMGASGSGKTTLLQYIVYEKNLCNAAIKYSTRKTRPDEIGNDGRLLMRDDVRHLPLKKLEKKCDVLYEINNNKYGVNTKEIIKGLDSDSKGLVLILSNVRAIKFLKKKVEDEGHLVKVIYLLSRMDSETEFTRTWQKRVAEELTKADNLSAVNKKVKDINGKIEKELLSFVSNLQKNPLELKIEGVTKLCNAVTNLLPQSESGKKRSEKIRLMFTQYVNNIGLFDYVILNTSTKEDMFKQAINIIKYNNDTNKQRLAKHKLLKGPIVFVLCASPKSGKGTLMENLNIMGSSQIQITPKYADRDPAPNDKRDGMYAKGKTGFELEFPDGKENNCWTWSFHAAADGSSTRYAVKKEDIVSRLNKGVCQIFVSNFEQLERVTEENDTNLLNILNDIRARLVFIYLYRVRTFDEIDEQVLDERKRVEINEVHDKYMKNITKIDHVIINPDYSTYSEDLHDQMMSLIELYQGGGGL